jgi:hypothetical protein
VAASPKASRSKAARSGSDRSDRSKRGQAPYSPWGYWSTDGFGFHEFLQFSEDIGADALVGRERRRVVFVRSGTFLPDSDVPA